MFFRRDRLAFKVVHLEGFEFMLKRFPFVSDADHFTFLLQVRADALLECFFNDLPLPHKVELTRPC